MKIRTPGLVSVRKRVWRMTLLVRSKYSKLLKPWSDGLPAPNGLGKTLQANSGPFNVVLRAFRMFPCYSSSAAEP